MGEACTAACADAHVQINQCWGTPQYAQCLCGDGTARTVPGCPCEHSTCPTVTPSPTTTAEPEPEPEPEPTVAPTERPTVTPTVAPTLAPTVAPTLAPTSSSTSFARTEWWPGCGCGPVTWITDHKSKESCEIALCEVALITLHQSSWQDDGSVARQIESDIAESEQTNRRGKESAPSQATHDKRKTHGFLQLSLMQAWAHMETVLVNSIQEKKANGSLWLVFVFKWP